MLNSGKQKLVVEKQKENLKNDPKKQCTYRNLWNAIVVFHLNAEKKWRSLSPTITEDRKRIITLRLKDYKFKFYTSKDIFKNIFNHS